MLSEVDDLASASLRGDFTGPPECRCGERHGKLALCVLQLSIAPAFDAGLIE